MYRDWINPDQKFILEALTEADTPKVMFKVVATKHSFSLRHFYKSVILPVSLIIKSAETLKAERNLPLLMKTSEN